MRLFEERLNMVHFVAGNCGLTYATYISINIFSIYILMSSDSRSSDYSILSRKTKLLQFEIKPNAIENWRCLNPHIPRAEAKDCAIQSLTFLQVIKDRKLAEYYADIAHKKGGYF